jgi:predicted aspartyl protease
VAIGRGYRFLAAVAVAFAVALAPGSHAWAADPPSDSPPVPATINPVPGTPGASVPAPVEEVLVTAPVPRYVAPTTRDSIGRIWAPVLINGKGPYRLVLDTGASNSALTRRVAEEVALPIRENAAKLRGVTGATLVATAKVASLQVGELLVENATVPLVADAFGGAEGVLGGEGLEDKRIVIEFRKDRISVARSRRQAPPPGFSVLPFKYSRERGMRVEVLVGSIKTVAMIDTGAEVTIGNLALREAVARRRGEGEMFEDTIIGVTEDEQKAASMKIPGIVAGQLIVRNVTISFSDLYIFEHWRLNSRPALLIGMDVLGLLDTLIIDYRRNELQLRTTR